ncbi:hypothetical protein GCM10025867_02080 [Frondihabitans sucicola]|uniref:Xylose isomerase-like TIM barrel domain-containing protein n=1 Tax=Frondihabitans sucicola TaxID=1268041 RepID=A0ABM8GHW3_9MICO|nr:TIM barrel protein [Frondihabitans sucicola]BDZ47967.1 hypothetical protein GCM10025867_02080 [Frondihabitans sucicola]
MLAELGYAATNLTLWSEPAWADLPRLARVAEANDLSVATVYVTIDISKAPTDEATQRALDMIRTIEATRTVEIALIAGTTFAPSDMKGDAAARAFLDQALAAAETNGVTLLLYPHTFGWMEHVDDAVRLAAAYDDPRLGLSLSVFHWYATDRSDLRGTVRRAAPYLGMVNISGSRPQQGSYFPATIEPVGQGEFDAFHFLAVLRDNDYSGPLGVQSYGIGGDPYTSFEQSRNAIRKMEERLARQPTWGSLRADRI